MKVKQSFIIGIAGTFASGQDSVGSYLNKKYDFMYVSTSDMVRAEAKKRYGSIERPILFKTATELRFERGGGVLSELALEKFDENDKQKSIAITGIRSLGEAKVVQAAGGIIIFTDAPLNVRYERMKSRKRDGEIGLTLEQFKQREDNEAKTGDSDEDFNRDAIAKLADYKLSNDDSLEVFHDKIDKLMEKLSK